MLLSIVSKMLTLNYALTWSQFQEMRPQDCWQLTYQNPGIIWLNHPEMLDSNKFRKMSRSPTWYQLDRQRHRESVTRHHLKKLKYLVIKIYLWNKLCFVFISRYGYPWPRPTPTQYHNIRIKTCFKMKIHQESQMY